MENRPFSFRKSPSAEEMFNSVKLAIVYVSYVAKVDKPLLKETNAGLTFSIFLMAASLTTAMIFERLFSPYLIMRVNVRPS